MFWELKAKVGGPAAKQKEESAIVYSYVVTYIRITLQTMYLSWFCMKVLYFGVVCILGMKSGMVKLFFLTLINGTVLKINSIRKGYFAKLIGMSDASLLETAGASKKLHVAVCIAFPVVSQMQHSRLFLISMEVLSVHVYNWPCQRIAEGWILAI